MNFETWRECTVDLGLLKNRLSDSGIQSSCSLGCCCIHRMLQQSRLLPGHQRFTLTRL